MTMIVIIDYGVGNLGSIGNMLKRVGVASTISNDVGCIRDAQKLILPGVGAFDAAMSRLNSSGLRDVLEEKALVDRVPTLGICLGMQLLTRGSEEGTLPGLGWIPAATHRFPDQPGLKIPHMGWNLVTPSSPSPLTEGFPNETRFYFVHSYYVRADDPLNSILKTTHGLEFDAAIHKDNVFGAQFHPEKSHRFGMRLLQNFAGLN
jgi:imidazole glycerol-phosphate synthase subunit HisH